MFKYSYNYNHTDNRAHSYIASAKGLYNADPRCESGGQGLFRWLEGQ